MRLVIVAAGLAACAAAIAFSPPEARTASACRPQWRRVVTNAPKGSTINSLVALSRDDIWAVGSTGSVGSERTLIEHWDDHAWRVIASPRPDGGQLRDVAAIGPRDIWAVGLANGIAPHALIEHWDGKRWQRVGVTAPALSLWGVSGSGPKDVWAVGTDDAGVVVLHWDGSLWLQAPAPNAPDVVTGSTFTPSYLDGVAAISPTDVWVVGDQARAAFSSTPLIARWNGHAWRRYRLQAPFGLGALSVVSPDDIWAAGGLGGTGVVAHWNGSRWRLVPHPAMDGPSSDIAAVSASDVWALHPVMRWNGRRWTVLRELPTDGFFVTIAALSPTDVWAAGYYDLIEHYTC
jgi:hypothetical protein